eukprot:2479493-Lingulodinium_polyedra.AAC.1
MAAASDSTVLFARVLQGLPWGARWVSAAIAANLRQAASGTPSRRRSRTHLVVDTCARAAMGARAQ